MRRAWLGGAVMAVWFAACGDAASSDTAEPTDTNEVRDTRDVPEFEVRDTADGEGDPGPQDTGEPDDTRDVTDTRDITDVQDTTDTTDVPDATDTTDTSSTTDSWVYVPPQTSCGETVFRFDPPGDPAQVYLTGSHWGWAGGPPGAVAMTKGADGVHAATVVLPPGEHVFKFIADGQWMHSPDAAQVDDGFGGLNNQLTVPPCNPLRLERFEVAGDTFDARFGVRTMAAVERIEATEVTVTIDHEPAPAGGVRQDGAKVVVGWSGLAVGIHDVRVTYAGQTQLLKVLVGVSPDWRDANLYFVMTDRFANGDVRNDAPVEGVDTRVNWKGGDFAGVTDKLEEGYFDRLGVNTLWLSWPIAQATGYHDGARPESHRCGQSSATTGQTPTRFTAYHGYWPSRLDQIEPRFGTREELRQLIHTAHGRGIRVLLDFTANHVHESSPMYQQHMNDGWFNQPAEVCEVVGWDNKPKTCWFTPYLPDLDYRHPDLREAMLAHAVDVALSTGADGYRLDAVKHIEPGFLPDLRQRLAAAVEQSGVDFYLVGETFTGDAALIDTFVGKDRLHGQFDFPANYKILQALAKNELGLGTMDGDIRAIRRQYKDNGALMSTFIGNHDMARFTSMASGDMFCGVWELYADIAQGWLYPPPQPTAELPYKKLALAFAYIMTVPGVPLIYYGDEVGLAGANDPDNRRMMMFGASLSAPQSAALTSIGALTSARARHPSLTRGAWPAPILAENDLLVFARTLPAEKSLVVLNRGATSRTVNIPLASLSIAADASFADALGSGSLRASGGSLQVDVPGTGYRILVHSPP